MNDNWRPTTEIPTIKDDGSGYEISDIVLVFVKDRGVSFGYAKRRSKYKLRWKWESTSVYYRGQEITHWMPLPEPPKED